MPPEPQVPVSTINTDGQAAEPHQPVPGLLRRETYAEARMLLSRTYLNILLVFVPLGLGAGFLGLRAEVVFWLNWLAIVPLAPTITMAVLKLSADIGQIRGGLIKAILGNTVEMIMCVVAMIKGQIPLVQSMIIGSILSYSLLLLGCSYLVASLGKESVSYSQKQTGLMSALMMVVSISLVIPTIVTLAHSSSPHHHIGDNILNLSRGIAIVILLLFIAYLMFRFRTHQSVFTVCTTDNHIAPRRRPLASERTDAKSDVPRLRLVYLAATACVIVCSIYTIDSLETATQRMHFTRPFVGAVLMPLVGNLGKSIIIISHARAGRIDKSIRLIMTNVLDTLLFITPFLVLFGWIVRLPMELEFGLFQAIVFILAIMVMKYLIQPGMTTYFEGAMLIGTYLVIAVAFFVVT